MKRVVLFVFVILLAMSVTAAYAGDGCSKAAKKSCAKSCGLKAKDTTAKGDDEKKAETEVKDKHAGCAHAAKVEETVAGKEHADHVCPDVKDRAALNDFHTAMHPMHVALSDEDYAAIRAGYPKLMATTKAVNAYNCDGYDKCSDACRTNLSSSI